MAVPQFGEPDAGRTYPDRPAVFGLVLNAGKIAVVRVEVAGMAPWWDLPGGGIEAGESEAQALVREFGEEAGLLVSPNARFASADQYFFKSDGAPFNNRGHFWTVELVRAAPELQIEPEHSLVWVDAPSAIAMLRHDAHAWAVASWMRCVAPGDVNR